MTTRSEIKNNDGTASTTMFAVETTIATHLDWALIRRQEIALPKDHPTPAQSYIADTQLSLPDKCIIADSWYAVSKAGAIVDVTTGEDDDSVILGFASPDEKDAARKDAFAAYVLDAIPENTRAAMLRTGINSRLRQTQLVAKKVNGKQKMVDEKTLTEKASIFLEYWLGGFTRADDQSAVLRQELAMMTRIQDATAKLVVIMTTQPAKSAAATAALGKLMQKIITPDDAEIVALVGTV